MAYNYFPTGYQNQFYGQMPQQQLQQQPQQIQNGGLVSVRSRAEAQNYPVAPGNSVTFKDETAPFVYTKTMGFSQLDRPVFEIFRLVKEDNSSFVAETAPKIDSTQNNIDLSAYATKDELGAILSRLEALEKKEVKKHDE